MDQGRLALIIREETTSLTRTPEASSAQNLVVEKRDFQLAERGAATIIETTEAHGTAEATYRTLTPARCKSHAQAARRLREVCVFRGVAEEVRAECGERFQRAFSTATRSEQRRSRLH